MHTPGQLQIVEAKTLDNSGQWHVYLAAPDGRKIAAMSTIAKTYLLQAFTLAGLVAGLFLLAASFVSARPVPTAINLILTVVLANLFITQGRIRRQARGPAAGPQREPAIYIGAALLMLVIAWTAAVVFVFMR